MSAAPPVVLTVAGSDPSGGAGLQADLKTFHQHRVYGAAVPTLLTAQSTRGVERVELLPAGLVEAQLNTLRADLEPAAAKTGALGSPETARLLGTVMEASRFGWVVDPVWLPSEGRPLSRGDVVEAYKEAIVPRATLITPNIQEASLLSELPIRSLDDAEEAARQIASLGAAAVLVKGGHLEGSARGTDVLFHGGAVTRLAPAERVPGTFHGTGCALSAAIASRLALGADVPTAVRGAKGWLGRALRHAFAVGKGAKPVNHLWPIGEET